MAREDQLSSPTLREVTAAAQAFLDPVLAEARLPIVRLSRPAFDPPALARPA